MRVILCLLLALTLTILVDAQERLAPLLKAPREDGMTHNATWPARTGGCALVVNDAIMVVGGKSSAGLLADAWSWSSPEYGWVDLAATGFSPRYGHRCIWFGGEVVLVGGLAETPGAQEAVVGDMYTSMSGATFSQRNTPDWGPLLYPGLAISNDYLWILDSSKGSIAVWRSPDLLLWEPVVFTSRMVPADRVEPAWHELNGRLWLVGGAKASGGEEVWSLDPIKLAWSSFASAATYGIGASRHVYAGSTVHAGTITLVGGVSEEMGEWANDVLAFDGTSVSLSAMSPAFGVSSPMVVSFRRTLIVLGGDRHMQEFFDSIWVSGDDFLPPPTATTTPPTTAPPTTTVAPGTTVPPVEDTTTPPTTASPTTLAPTTVGPTTTLSPGATPAPTTVPPTTVPPPATTPPPPSSTAEPATTTDPPTGGVVLPPPTDVGGGSTTPGPADGGDGSDGDGSTGGAGAGGGGGIVGDADIGASNSGNIALSDPSADEARRQMMLRLFIAVPLAVFLLSCCILLGSVWWKRHKDKKKRGDDEQGLWLSAVAAKSAEKRRQSNAGTDWEHTSARPGAPADNINRTIVPPVQVQYDKVQPQQPRPRQPQPLGVPHPQPQLLQAAIPQSQQDQHRAVPPQPSAAPAGRVPPPTPLQSWPPPPPAAETRTVNPQWLVPEVYRTTKPVSPAPAAVQPVGVAKPVSPAPSRFTYDVTMSQAGLPQTQTMAAPTMFKYSASPSPPAGDIGGGTYIYSIDSDDEDLEVGAAGAGAAGAVVAGAGAAGVPHVQVQSTSPPVTQQLPPAPAKQFRSNSSQLSSLASPSIPGMDTPSMMGRDASSASSSSSMSTPGGAVAPFTPNPSAVFPVDGAAKKQHMLPTVVAKSLVSSFDLQRSDVQLGAIVGRGGFGTVYRGEYRGSSCAVKVLDAPAAEILSSFDRELSAMCSLHNNRLVQVYGACRDPQAPFIVMEWMERGSLYECLHGAKKPALSMSTRLQIATQIVEGVVYMHQSQMVHTDIKSHNILLDSAWRAKIADFGFAQVIAASSSSSSLRSIRSNLNSQTSPSISCGGTLAYLPPEALGEDVVAPDTALDMYATGVVLWELFSGEVPWSGLTFTQIMCQVGMYKKSLPLHGKIPAPIRSILKQLFSARSSRPSARTVLQQLRAVDPSNLVAAAAPYKERNEAASLAVASTYL